MEFFDTNLGIFLIILGQCLLVTVLLLVSLAFLLYMDRKVWAAVQLRKGPNVVGPFGLLQSFADFGKFIMKEVVIPAGADKYVFAVGANGATVVSTNGSPFKTPRFDPRAPALYALAQDTRGTEPVVYGVGEYGSLTRYDTDGASLSGSISGVDLDGQGRPSAVPARRRLRSGAATRLWRFPG